MLKEIEKCIYKGYKENIINNNFQVKENNLAAKCRIAKFKKTGEILVYKFDKTPKRDSKEIIDKFPFFEEIPKLKSICDFIFFYNKKPGKLYIILCNLKSNSKGNSPDQLKAGKIFSEFIIQNVMRLFPEYSKIDLTFYEVLFSTKQLYKASTNPKNSSLNTPKNFVSNSEQVDTCDLDNLCRH